MSMDSESGRPGGPNPSSKAPAPADRFADFLYELPATATPRATRAALRTWGFDVDQFEHAVTRLLASVPAAPPAWVRRARERQRAFETGMRRYLERFAAGAEFPAAQAQVFFRSPRESEHPLPELSARDLRTLNESAEFLARTEGPAAEPGGPT